MGKGSVLCAAALAAFSAAAGPALAQQGCQSAPIDSVPIHADIVERPRIPVLVDGQEEVFLVGTGSFVTTVSPKLVAKYKLKPRTDVVYGPVVSEQGNKSMYLIGVEIDSVAIGKLAITYNDHYYIAPPGFLPSNVAGILGSDFLQSLKKDLDFDFPGQKLSFFEPTACAGQVGYWKDGDYSSIRFGFDDGNLIHFHVSLDGQDIDSALDTGLARATWDIDRARARFRWSKDPPEMEESPVGLSAITYYRYPFKSLSFGGIEVVDPDIMLAPDFRRNQSDRMALGMSVLKDLHMYISYKSKTIYLARHTGG